MSASTLSLSRSPRPQGGLAGKVFRIAKGYTLNRILLVVSSAWVLIVLVCAIAPAMLSPDDPTELYPERVLQPPGANALLGTDHYGRSVVTLLIYGARTAVIIGLSATVIALVVGTAIGLLAGYVGGVVDMLIGRLLDILMSFPGVLMALIIAAALGPTTRNLIIAVGVSAVPQFARVMRGQTMTVRSKLYVEAAKASGYNTPRIVFGHVLPNAIAPVVVLGTLTVGVSIVLTASLSFLGLGPKSLVPDWGQLLALGQPYLASAWWISTFAGLALTVTVIAISIMGDSLSDIIEKG